MNKKIIIVLLSTSLVITIVVFNNLYEIKKDSYKEFNDRTSKNNNKLTNTLDFNSINNEKQNYSDTNEDYIKEIPSKELLKNNYHVYQTFNNCGPATLSMLLNYYGLAATQDDLGKQLRPFQNPQGDNDDKNVFLKEIGNKAEELGYVSYFRPNGTIDLLKEFVTNDIPVITITWLNEKEDIGHYRIITGFDDTTKFIIQDDSYQGPNKEFSYVDFTYLWQPFNYQYLVIVPKDKEEIVKQILGEEVDEEVAWKNTLDRATREAAFSNSFYTTFNQSVANYYLNNNVESIQLYEEVKEELPRRMLWYQIEPILAYKETGDTNKALALIDEILSNNNKAFSELYLIRGDIYFDQGNLELAKNEYEKALLYNKNLEEAKTALAKVN